MWALNAARCSCGSDKPSYFSIVGGLNSSGNDAEMMDAENGWRGMPFTVLPPIDVSLALSVKPC